MRRAARALAVEALYEWLLSGNAAPEVAAHVAERVEERLRHEAAELARECVAGHDAATLAALMRAEAAPSVPDAILARARRHARGERQPRDGGLDRGFTAELDGRIAERFAFARLDADTFPGAFLAAAAAAPDLEATLAPALDREVRLLSPAERAILLLGTFELKHRPDIPYRVAISEAVELAKDYGGTDGHKFVNGVLDRVAAGLRPDERKG
jgi:N utilization substance protein B